MSKPEITLLPCPFCGGKAEFLSVEQRKTHGSMIECMRCETTGPMSETDAEAIATWNRRVTVQWRKPEDRCGGQAVAIDEADGEPCCAFSYQGKWYFCTNTADPDLEFTPKAWASVFAMRGPK